MITSKIGYSLSPEISGSGTIEYTDTQAYPKVTFQVRTDHKVVTNRIIKYLTTPRKFNIPDMAGMPGTDIMLKPIAPSFRVDFFQQALAEMNAVIGIALIRE